MIMMNQLTDYLVNRGVLCLSLCLLAFGGVAQDVNTVQPSVMIMPYVSSGGNALEKFETDNSYRSCIAAIEEAFQKRGFVTDDFQESINRLKTDNQINSLNNLEFDWEKSIRDNSGADVVVRAEIILTPQQGNLTRMEIILKAVEKASSGALASLTPEVSIPYPPEAPAGTIAIKVLERDGQIDEFLNNLNAKFSDMVANGRIVKIEIYETDESEYSLEDEVGDDYDYISDLLNDWVAENSYKNYYKVRTGSRALFYEVKIPLRDENGNNYSEAQLERSMRKKIAEYCAMRDGIRPKVARGDYNTTGLIKFYMP